MTLPPNESDGPIRSAIACLLVFSLVPVCATLAMGGADWEVSGAFRVSWYEEWVAWAMLAAACVSTRQRVCSDRLARFASWASLCLLGVATVILWTGGARFAFVSLRNPDTSGWLGVGATLFACALAYRRARMDARNELHDEAQDGGGTSRTGLAGGHGGLIAVLGLGLILYLALARIDAARIAASIDSGRSNVAPQSSTSYEVEPDIVWIVVDTLRADALGAYRKRTQADAADSSGLPAARTPFLDGLAERGIVFERVLSAAPWTLPSMMSMFTSRWPSTLDPEGRGGVRRADDLIALDSALPTWVERLRARGYHTAGFQKNPFLGHGSGFDAAFDLYRVVGGDRAEQASAEQLVCSVLRWANEMKRRRRAEGTRRFLLYMHFMDPHVDYRPPSRWLSEATRAYAGDIDGRAGTLHERIEQGPPIGTADRDQLRRLYADEVAYLDAELARLWTGLRDRGLVDERTLIVVTADHGEQFGEHGGWEHGDLHVENLHVPLILAGAGLEPRRIPDPTSLVDLGPTVLDVLGLAAFDGAEGRSRLSRNGAPVGSEGDSLQPVFSEYGERSRIEMGRWVLIEGQREGVALFDREADPGERFDRAGDHPDLVSELASRLEVHRSRELSSRPPPRRGLDERTREALRALGYAQ